MRCLIEILSLLFFPFCSLFLAPSSPLLDFSISQFFLLLLSCSYFLYISFFDVKLLKVFFVLSIHVLLCVCSLLFIYFLFFFPILFFFTTNILVDCKAALSMKLNPRFIEKKTSFSSHWNFFFTFLPNSYDFHRVTD